MFAINLLRASLSVLGGPLCNVTASVTTQNASSRVGVSCSGRYDMLPQGLVYSEPGTDDVNGVLKYWFIVLPFLRTNI